MHKNRLVKLVAGLLYFAAVVAFALAIWAGITFASRGLGAGWSAGSRLWLVVPSMGAGLLGALTLFIFASILHLLANIDESLSVARLEWGNAALKLKARPEPALAAVAAAAAAPPVAVPAPPPPPAAVYVPEVKKEEVEAPPELPPYEDVTYLGMEPPAEEIEPLTPEPPPDYELPDEPEAPARFAAADLSGLSDLDARYPIGLDEPMAPRLEPEPAFEDYAEILQPEIEIPEPAERAVEFPEAGLPPFEMPSAEPEPDTPVVRLPGVEIETWAPEEAPFYSEAPAEIPPVPDVPTEGQPAAEAKPKRPRTKRPAAEPGAPGETEAQFDDLQSQIAALQSRLSELQVTGTANGEIEPQTEPPPPSAPVRLPGAEEAARIADEMKAERRPRKPRNGVKNGSAQKDDLTAIRGIDQAVAQRLAEHGITSFEQLALAGDAALSEIAGDRPEGEDWRGQARTVAAYRAVPSRTFTAPDDLTAIRGIDAVFARRLAEAGIETFDDLVDAPDDVLESATRGNLDRGQREDWREHARLLADYLESGRRAAGLISSEPDNMNLIEGIGATFAKRLVEAGITTYAKLARASDEILVQVTNGNLDRAQRQDWRGQARRLARQKR